MDTAQKNVNLEGRHNTYFLDGGTNGVGKRYKTKSKIIQNSGEIRFPNFIFGVLVRKYVKEHPHHEEALRRRTLYPIDFSLIEKGCSSHALHHIQKTRCSVNKPMRIYLM